MADRDDLLTRNTACHGPSEPLFDGHSLLVVQHSCFEVGSFKTSVTESQMAVKLRQCTASRQLTQRPQVPEDEEIEDPAPPVAWKPKAADLAGSGCLGSWACGALQFQDFYRQEDLQGSSFA